MLGQLNSFPSLLYATPYPNIELSREEPLRNSDGVEECAGDVEAAHEDEPADGHLVDRLVPTVDHAVVRGRRDAGEAEGDEDSGAQGTESVGDTKKGAQHSCAFPLLLTLLSEILHCKVS